MEHSHYFKNVRNLNVIDVYKVCELFGVEDPSGALQHAIKKLLVPGKRGVKDRKQDIKEAIDTLNRYMKSDSEWLGRLPQVAPPAMPQPPIQSSVALPKFIISNLVESLRQMVEETATCCGSVADKQKFDTIIDALSRGIGSIKTIHKKGDRTYLIDANGINHIDDYTKARKINDRTFVVTESLARELGVID